MNDRLIGALVMLLVVPAIGIAGASLATGSAHQTDVANETQPGERLAGVVSVQQAELGGELSERQFGLQFAAASDNETRAAVVAAQANETDRRLAALEDRLETLVDRRDAGEISQGRYAAETARIDAERRSLARLANYTQRTAAELPSDVRTQRGLNATTLQALSERAAELGGEEIRDIARSIAGPRVGQSIAEQRGQGPPTGIPGGPPGNATHPGGPHDGGHPGNSDDRPGASPGSDSSGQDTEPGERGGESGESNRTDATDADW